MLHNRCISHLTSHKKYMLKMNTRTLTDSPSQLVNSSEWQLEHSLRSNSFVIRSNIGSQLNWVCEGPTLSPGMMNPELGSTESHDLQMLLSFNFLMNSNWTGTWPVLATVRARLEVSMKPMTPKSISVVSTVTWRLSSWFISIQIPCFVFALQWQGWALFFAESVHIMLVSPQAAQ